MLHFKKTDIYVNDEEYPDDIFSIKEFIDAIKYAIGIDDGGVCGIIVDGFNTNICLNNAYALNKVEAGEVAASFEDLLELDKSGAKVELLWASK